MESASAYEENCADVFCVRYILIPLFSVGVCTTLIILIARITSKVIQVLFSKCREVNCAVAVTLCWIFFTFLHVVCLGRDDWR